MSLGAWRTRILCRIKIHVIHHASVRYHSVEASSQKHTTLFRDPVDTRGDPLLKENLPHAQSLLNSPEYLSKLGQRPGPPSANQRLTSSYLSIRDNPQSLKELTVKAYVLLVEEAQTYSLQQILNLLASDLLCHFPRHSDPEGFSTAAVSILSPILSNCALTPQWTLELFNALIALNQPQRILLNFKGWERVYSAAISYPDLCQFSLASLSVLLLTGQSEQAYERITWITYRMIIEILMRGEESFPEALTVFQQIVRLDRVPKLAQQLAQDEGGSFKIMIASTLIRGCLEFNWYIRAAELIIELLRDPRWSQAQGTSAEDIHATTLLGLEVLHVIVRSPTRQEVPTCRVLIQALLSMSSLHRASPPVEIPHADLLAFYEACYDYNFIDIAASVYVQLHSPPVRQRHHYPPPRGSALFWLFDHFADPGVSSKVEGKRPSHKGYIRMARIILNDIIYHGTPIPVVDRPRFIAIAAARGFGFYARQLWEMYTVEADLNRDVVRGNAHMLVPVVKLFRKLQEAWDNGVNREHTTAAKHAIDGLSELNNPDGSAAIKNQSTQKVATIHAKKSVLPDAWRFANHVLNSYKATKLPLAMASQEDLNALARAHLILDHVSEGVEALSIVMERGDIPDLKDVNVALGAIARYSPRHAARMLEHMVRCGVGPSPSAYSAVLHAALKTEDFTLVNVLITRARKLGYGALTPKAIAALVQSITTFKYTEDKAERNRQKSNVQAVMETVEAIMESPPRQNQNRDHEKDHVLSVKMAQKCIDAALTAMEPELAMRFWKLLVKDRVLWDDQESKTTRMLIGECIRDQWKGSQLHDEEAREMLEELGIEHVE